MFQAEDIRNLVEKNIEGAKVFVRDTTGTQDHFELVVISVAFSDKNQVQRHRMIYSSLGDHVGGAIHALSLKTLTPEEAKGEGYGNT